MSFTIHAQKLFTGTSVRTNAVVACDNGTISQISDFSGNPADYQCECLAPGFFDIHINGGERFYFTKERSSEALTDIETSCLAEGTAFTLPTLITSSPENIFEGIATVRKYMADSHGGGVPGMHLEGPFLHPLRRGAHLAKYLLKPTDRWVDRIIDEGKGVIRMLTIAPELFSDAQLDRLIDSGIIISAGHSNATFEEAKNAFDRGIRVVTHLFNAMSPFTHRSPGLIGAALEDDRVYAPVIADGAHCHYASVALAHKLKKEKLVLISDALFVGRKVTEFQWDEFHSKLTDGKYLNPEGNLSGATISLAEAVRNVVQQVGVPIEEAVAMATIRAARAVGMDGTLGQIDKGFPARFTAFDANLTTFQTVVPSAIHSGSEQNN